MKKVILSFILIFLFSMSYANAVFIKDNEKYISIHEAENLWDIEINLKERSGIIEIKTEDEKIFLQIGSNVVVKNVNYNPLFLNVDMFKLSGTQRIESAPFLMEGVVYIPVNFFHDLLYDSNEYDIIVVSTEPEGITAAVSASRMGAKVLLLGNEDTPGGLLVHGMLNTLDMNYDDNGVLLTQGIFKEFYSAIGNTESFDIKRAEKFFTNLINNELTITYKNNQKNITPILNKNKIIGVTVNGEQEKNEYYAKIIIDATPDGEICYLSGVPYYAGMEDINITDSYMAVTLVFCVSGVDWHELAQDVTTYRNETGDTVAGINESSAWAFGKWCYDKYTPIFDNMKLRGLNVGKQDDGTILINALQILGVNGLDKESVESAKNYGKKEVENVIEYLRKILPSFHDAELLGTADELYIRETRHIKGEYTLKATELLEGVVFDDKISSGSYPIDIQSTSVSDNGFVIGVPDVYTIPYRCIVPQEIDNLYIIGKAASYSSVAAGSLRVVPVGMAVGESAGIAAVYAIKENIAPREVINDNEKVAEIQNLIIGQGGYLAEYKEPQKIAETNYYNTLKELINLGVLGGGYDNNFKLDEEATTAEFCRIIRAAMQRLGKEADYTEINEKLEEYKKIEKLDTTLAAKIMLDICGEEIEYDEAFEKATLNGYFLTLEYGASKGKRLLNEDMYEIAYNFAKMYNLE